MLTARQLEVLQVMAARTDANDFDGAEIAQEGIVCYLGLERIGYKTLAALIDHCAVSLEQGDSSMRRFTISKAGRMMARHPEKADEFWLAVHRGQNVFVTDDGFRVQEGRK